MAKFFAVFVCALASFSSAAEVTVYNSDLGLVKDRRTLTLRKGVVNISVEDVAAQIDPTSVHFKDLSAPAEVKVLEQDFRYDLASPDKILDLYLGKEIEIDETSQDLSKRNALKGVLLSNAGGRVISSGGKIFINPPGSVILPELPNGLLTKPTLVWKLESGVSGAQDAEISYLTSGLSWSADYVFVLSKDDSKADMSSWVTVVNNSGATYRDAHLKFVAGDVHRAPQPMAGFGGMRKSMALAQVSSMEMEEKPFFEYHIYTLPRATTLLDNSSKQTELASASDIPVKKLYIYDGAQGVQWSNFGANGFWNPNYGVSSGKKVSVVLQIENRKTSGLGIPLPAGRVRVYKEDDGSLQMAGEDALDHTPKDETVRLKMGESFDLAAERTRVNYTSNASAHDFVESFEITLRNHKDEDVNIVVVEHLYRWTSWEISGESAKWNKKDAQTIEFPVVVPKNGEKTVTYTVHYLW